ncbi:hypothetical protein [Enterococcus larvae]|uniref:hypothetical protein n=1 Tax=Enterococcus larvae TaxID=2794352 RepID=UPI003F31EF92
MRKRETLEKFENLVELVKEETKDIAREIVRQSDTFDDALKTWAEYYYDEESRLHELVHAEIFYQMVKKETGYK